MGGVVGGGGDGSEKGSVTKKKGEQSTTDRGVSLNRITGTKRRAVTYR